MWFARVWQLQLEVQAQFHSAGKGEGKAERGLGGLEPPISILCRAVSRPRSPGAPVPVPPSHGLAAAASDLAKALGKALVCWLIQPFNSFFLKEEEPFNILA